MPDPFDAAWKHGFGTWGPRFGPQGTPTTRSTSPASVTIGPGDPPVLSNLPHGHIGISCSNPSRVMHVLLNTAGVQVVGGGPRRETADRVQRVSVPEYVGHDPVRMTVSVLLDKYAEGESVWSTILELDEFAQRLPHEAETPIIRLSGPTLYPDRLWRIDGPFQWDTDPEPIRNQRAWLLRQALTIPVVEVVTDTLLQSSITEARKQAAKNAPRSYRVRKGQDDFGDVSKALYGNRNRAIDLARLNGLPYGTRLKTHQRIKVLP